MLVNWCNYIILVCLCFGSGNIAISDAPLASWIYFVIVHCNIIRASRDTEEQKLSCRKNGQRKILGEWHHLFWLHLFHLCHFLSLFLWTYSHFNLNDVLFEWSHTRTIIHLLTIFWNAILKNLNSYWKI